MSPHSDPGLSLCRQNIIVVVNPCGVEARWEIGLRLAAVDRYVSLTALMLINWVNSFIDIQQVEHESRHHRSRSSLNHLYHFCEFQPWPSLILLILNETKQYSKTNKELLTAGTSGYFGVPWTVNLRPPYRTAWSNLTDISEEDSID